MMNPWAKGWESLHPPEELQSYHSACWACGEASSLSDVGRDNRSISADEHVPPGGSAEVTSRTPQTETPS